MKLIQLIFILAIFSISIFSQNGKIQIVDLENTVTEYRLDEISNISFDLENLGIAIVRLSDNSVEDISLDGETTITFDNNYLIFNNNNEISQFDLNEIVSLRFEPVPEINNYPFGELEVDEIVLDGLNNPWSIDFLDNDNIIYTEHDGRLFRHQISTGNTEQISGLPGNLRQIGQGGLLDVTIHPNYSNNKMIYLVYSISTNGQFTTAVGRGVLNGNQLTDFEEIFAGDPPRQSGVHFGSRIIFDNDGKLYFSIGDRGSQNLAQDSTNHIGSVMRINDDGSVPNDNPYLDITNAKPELYTMGNRNIQGMFYVPEIDEIWAIEHGPRGGDELNLIQAGENYSWPIATYGINYNGTPITEVRSIPGHIDPITYWVPSIAPCGMDLVNYNSENNELDVIIGTLAGSHLHRIRVRDYEVVETVRSLEGYGRFRDVQMSPDGYLYAAVQSPGRIIRLKSKD